MGGEVKGKAVDADGRRRLAFSNALWWLLLPLKMDNLRSMVGQAGGGGCAREAGGAGRSRGLQLIAELSISRKWLADWLYFFLL